MHTNAQFIQFKKALYYVHFGARKYLKQLAPDVLEDIENKKGKVA